MIKKHMFFSALMIISISIFNFSNAQNTPPSEDIYKLSFESMDQQMVKPLIGMLMPLFNQVPFIEQDVYGSFYYKVSGKLEKADIEKLIANSKYKLTEFSLVDQKRYQQMIDKSLTPKN